MPYTITRFDPTPNPNAIKCVLDREIVGPDEAPRSYRSRESAMSDPLATKLFGVDPAGTITSVLINADWITVNKAPDADWKRVKEAVRRILAQVE